MRQFKMWLLLLMMICLSACNLASSSEVSLTDEPVKPTPAEGAGIPSGTPINSSCSLTTIGETELRDLPGNWGQLIAVQGAGMTMPALAVSSNGWYKVPFGGDGGNLMEAWAAPNQLTAVGDCGTLETVQLSVPLTDCKVTNNTGASQILHVTPELIDGNLMGYFPAGETFPVIKKDGSWFMVYVEALSNSAWVEARLVTASAECTNI